MIKDDFKLCTIRRGEARFLFFKQMPIFYGTSKTEVDFDCYIFNDKYCILVTDDVINSSIYTTSERYRVNLDILNDLERKARAILVNPDISSEEAEKQIDELLNIFLEETFKKEYDGSF